MPRKKNMTSNHGRVVSMRMNAETWTDLIRVSRLLGYSASGFMRNAVFAKLREQGIEPVVEQTERTVLP